MKKTLIASTLIALFSTTAFAQEMSSADNQCRVKAKEIALQTYQTCISDSKTAKIEQIKQEYQAKIEELKSYYEAQILDLQVGANSNKTPEAGSENSLSSATSDTGADVNSIPASKLESEENLQVETLEEVPMTLEPLEKSEAIQSEDLKLSEPTVTLKPAPSKSLPAKKVTKAAKTKKATKQIAQKRVRGQKPVKGIAQKLPAKQVAPVAQSELNEDAQVNNQ